MTDIEKLEQMHPTIAWALMQRYDDDTLKSLSEADSFWTAVIADKIIKYREKRAREACKSHRLNYPIDEVLDDFVNRRTGKLVEAKRQLKKRFDGLDHDKQEAVMMAFMEYGGLQERDFIYGKLYGDDFFTDDYLPLVQLWWEMFQDGKMAKVVVKYCSREYILEHLEELEGRCNHATLCLRTGITPNPDRLPCWTYLYVMKTSGGQLRFREGEKVVLKWVREYLYEDGQDKLVHSLYDIPYVRRMLAYLGEMGLVEDIMAIDELENRLRPIRRADWGATAIKEIEEKFEFPEYIYRNIK